MIVAKKCYFWSVFPQISCGRYPPNLSKFPKPHFLLTCTYFRGRRHGRNLPMAKATDGLAFGTTRHCRIVACRPSRRPARGHLGVTSGSPPTHQNPCKLRCFLCVVLKNIVFYGVLWPSVLRKLILALYQKTMRFTWFSGSGGVPDGKK